MFPLVSNRHHSKQTVPALPPASPHIHCFRFDNKFLPLFVALLIFYNIQHRSAGFRHCERLDARLKFFLFVSTLWQSFRDQVRPTKIFVNKTKEKDRVTSEPSSFSFPIFCWPFRNFRCQKRRGNIFAEDLEHSKLRLCCARVLTNVRKYLLFFWFGLLLSRLYDCRSFYCWRKSRANYYNNVRNFRMRCWCR